MSYASIDASRLNCLLVSRRAAVKLSQAKGDSHPGGQNGYYERAANGSGDNSLKQQ